MNQEFPFLVVRLIPACYQVWPLRSDAPLAELKKIAQRHSLRTGRNCALVLGISSCIYFHPDGIENVMRPPMGGIIVGPGVVGAMDLDAGVWRGW